MRTPIQCHPDYHEGFYDAQQGEPLHGSSSTAYREGWLGWHEFRALVETGTKGTAREEWNRWLSR